MHESIRRRFGEDWYGEQAGRQLPARAALRARDLAVLGGRRRAAGFRPQRGLRGRPPRGRSGWSRKRTRWRRRSKLGACLRCSPLRSCSRSHSRPPSPFLRRRRAAGSSGCSSSRWRWPGLPGVRLRGEDRLPHLGDAGHARRRAAAPALRAGGAPGPDPLHLLRRARAPGHAARLAFAAGDAAAAAVDWRRDGARSHRGAWPAPGGGARAPSRVLDLVRVHPLLPGIRRGARRASRGVRASAGPASARAAGCVAVRPIHGGMAEMKRLYVRPQARGTGLGRRLAQAALAHGRELGFARMVLDTMPAQMAEAVALYRSMGFVPAAPYSAQPTPGALCMELSLR